MIMIEYQCYIFSDEFNQYCEKLETTPEWGGQLEVCDRKFQQTLAMCK